jgi:predicted O-methyltransferase YrrM
MQIAAYMLSCPAREAIRGQTLANLAATDWGEPAIVEIDQTTHERRQQRQTETAFRLLQRAVGDGLDFFLFLEDDLDFNRNLRRNLQQWYPLTQITPGDHFFASLYNPNVRALDRDDAKSFFIADPDSVYGSQAFLLSAATARHVVEKWESHIGMQDIKMSRLAAQVTSIYYHRPSLAQHTGQDSAWGGPYHQAPDFQREWTNCVAPRGVSHPIILNQMGKVEGWLDDREARLLADTVAGLSPATAPHCIVEIGSYCGKSTVVLGLALKQTGMEESRIFAIDRHDGRISTIGDGIACTAPTLDKFRRNIRSAGIASLVETVTAEPVEVAWSRAIDLLLVDGFHDYDHVSQDFRHFSPCIRPSGYVAFHDCAPHFPGVKRFVEETVRSGEYRMIATANSLAILEKREDQN